MNKPNEEALCSNKYDRGYWSPEDDNQIFEPLEPLNCPICDSPYTIATREGSSGSYYECLTCEHIWSQSVWW